VLRQQVTIGRNRFRWLFSGKPVFFGHQGHHGFVSADTHSVIGGSRQLRCRSPRHSVRYRLAFRRVCCAFLLHGVSRVLECSQQYVSGKAF
jgi:hypothetical protein